MSRKTQNQFLALVKSLWPLAKGSLAQVRKPCVRPHCQACAQGRKHPAFIFTYMDRKRRRCMHVPRPLVPLLRQAIHNGRLLETQLAPLGPELIREYRKQREQRKQP